MYLLNPIPGENWIVRLVAYCIRPTNSNDRGQMINSPDIFLGVCNTHLSIPDKFLIKMYLLDPIPGKD